MPTVLSLLIFSLIPLLYTAWLYQVNAAVPEPYLDEVFHVRQAQAYCAGKLQSWDPKITTPPGLYVLSYVFFKTKQVIFGRRFCDLVDLRCLNSLVGSFVIPAQLWDLSRHIRLPRQHDEKSIRAVVNICLFPLLFFFSGLYYTDVCSIGFVLGAYQYHVRSLRDSSASTSMNAVKVFVLGLCAISMRQTNIFWVAVFLAGLHGVHHVKRLSLRPSEQSTDSSYVSRATHDPPISEAYLEGIRSSRVGRLLLTSTDYVTTALSLATTALKDPISLLLALWPYLALLGSFTAFLLINGGVVLGEFSIQHLIVAAD
jgi:alpha-1,2-glucosyltransferase